MKILNFIRDTLVRALVVKTTLPQLGLLLFVGLGLGQIVLRTWILFFWARILG